MPFATANDGVKLNYVTRGTGGAGAPIVLVHGWSGSHRYFDNCVEQLAEKCAGRQIVAVDLRFHGDSDKPSWGFHVSRLAADLRDVLTELKLEQPGFGRLLARHARRFVIRARPMQGC